MSKGFENYLSSFWNYPQILVFFMYLWYFIERVNYPLSKMIPGHHKFHGIECFKNSLNVTGNLEDECKPAMMVPEENFEFFWFCMNSFILFATGFYCMFFARIFEQFGRMIRLIGSVISELLIFMLFFTFWLFLFTWLTRIAGQDVDDGDYTNLSVGNIYLMNTFRNSIGDLQPPSTSLWNSHV
jgi:hypothetical protein